MRGRSIPYSAAEKTFVEANAALLPIGELHAAFCAEFSRLDVSPANLNALRKRNGWRTGRTGRFEKGAVPANKGRACPEGIGGRHPNARATQFRLGERRGVAVKLYKPIGSERLSKNGYLERKIHDGMPLQSRWRAVHLIEWEAANGPLPKGMALKCLDGDRLNTAPENWEAIPRALLPRLAGGNGRGAPLLAYDDAPAELKPSVMAVARLAHAAGKKRRGKAGRSGAASASRREGR